jgi:hypothetical protein
MNIQYMAKAEIVAGMDSHFCMQHDTHLWKIEALGRNWMLLGFTERENRKKFRFIPRGKPGKISLL